jgi:tryptophan synthase alpha chain
LARIKAATKLPIAVGFGVKTKEQVSAIAELAEGVVVGSALVSAIAQSLDAEGKATPETGPKALALVQQLASALRAPAAAAAL